jgi:hypothetical protein
VTPAVHEQLAALLRYARAIPDSVRPERRRDATEDARLYFGGALTVLQRLDLVTLDEYREWWDRLTAQLPDQRPPGP